MIEVMRQGTPVEVDGLDAEWVLDLARDAELMARQAERAKLRAANRWVDINAATAESGVEVWGNAGALDCEVPIGGPGTPALAAFSAEPFGAALGISTISAMNLISVAVELKHRLPGLWALIGGVGGGGVEAEDGRPPHQSACQQRPRRTSTRCWRRSWPPGVAPRSSRWCARRSPGSTPSRHAEAEQAGKAAWDVKITHPGVGEWAGTSWLDACADTVDLTKFGDLVADIARRLGEAGDPDTLEQRRAKAIGIVADVHAGADLDDLIAALVAPADRTSRYGAPRVRTRDLQLYIHLPADDLEAGDGASPPSRASAPPPWRGSRPGWPGTPPPAAGSASPRSSTWPARCGRPARPAALDGRTGPTA